MLISKEVQFDAGHRIPNHKSKCRNPHGHRYRVVAYCTGAVIEVKGDSSEGMLIDFSDLKRFLTQEVHDPLDHGFIVWEGDLTMQDALSIVPDWKVIKFPYIPTAENIARWAYEQLEPRINDRYVNDLKLRSVDVWETPTSCAQYP